MKSNYEAEKESKKLQTRVYELQDEVARLNDELDDYHQLKELLKRLVGLNG